MKRLGYTHYVAQGGDWGAPITSAMARQAAPGLLGIHINLPATVPPEVAAALAGGPLPAGLSEKERAVIEALMTYAKNGNSAYFTMLTARPQTVGYGATDSPAGLAAWILVHPGFAQWTYGADPKQSPTKDDVLDDITLYWLTNTATSSARLYWENGARGSVIVAAAQKTAEINLPVAITVFPDDVYRAPETWARRAYPKLIYFHEVDKGGHFAAWEQPELFAAELRAAFRSLREAPASGQADREAAPIYVDKIPQGYRDWKLISVAHEEGNLNSLGAILGNDVAIKAYREGTLPFPDGTIIASLHWQHASSAENNDVFGRDQSYVPGAPTNIQFM